MFVTERAAPEAASDGFNTLNTNVNLLPTNLQSTIEVDDKPWNEMAEAEKITFWGPICMCANRALRIEVSTTTPEESVEPEFVYHIVKMFGVSLVKGCTMYR